MSKQSGSRNLSEIEIVSIENLLNDGKSPTEIGRLLGRDPSGIRKEIKQFSSYFGYKKYCDLCLNKEYCNIGFLCKTIKDYKKCSSCKECDSAAFQCADYRIKINCKTLDKIHVCNSCARKEDCEVTYRYIAFQAITKHDACQNRSHVPLKFENLPEDFIDYLSDRI